MNAIRSALDGLDPRVRYATLVVLGFVLIAVLDYVVFRDTALGALRLAGVVMAASVVVRASRCGPGRGAVLGTTRKRSERGRDYHRAPTHVPACGCGACDETGADGAAELGDHVRGIVTLGFTEQVVRDGGW